MMNVGIIGAGHIAEKAARTLAQMDGMQCLAIGSRSLERAQAFAARFGIQRAYGSYADLLQDPDIGLVYIATPHSCHFEQSRDAILEGKPCLVEKSFMMNAVEAAAILALAREKGVFIAEAMWPRYMPVRTLAREVLASGLCLQPRWRIMYRGRNGCNARNWAAVPCWTWGYICSTLYACTATAPSGTSAPPASAQPPVLMPLKSSPASMRTERCHLCKLLDSPKASTKGS